MNRLRISRLLIVLSIATLSIPAVYAAPQSFEITDGQGEVVKVERGWFGSKKKVVKDRMGNGYSSKKGLFGTTEQEGSVLGNSFKRKKGFFGRSDIQGSTIFGDKVTTKKGLFGQRKTTVDVSGSAAMIKTLLGSKQPKATLSEPTTSFPPITAPSDIGAPGSF